MPCCFFHYLTISTVLFIEICCHSLQWYQWLVSNYKNENAHNEKRTSSNFHSISIVVSNNWWILLGTAAIVHLAILIAKVRVFCFWIYNLVEKPWLTIWKDSVWSLSCWTCLRVFCFFVLLNFQYMCVTTPCTFDRPCKFLKPMNGRLLSNRINIAFYT